jgi:hypothetical protein
MRCRPFRVRRRARGTNPYNNSGHNRLALQDTLIGGCGVSVTVNEEDLTLGVDPCDDDSICVAVTADRMIGDSSGVCLGFDKEDLTLSASIHATTTTTASPSQLPLIG